jgi:4'-phosphopantetheinyl transferase
MNSITPIAEPVLQEWRNGLELSPIAGREIRVLIVDLAAREITDERHGDFPEWGWLDAVERARAERFVRARDRRRFILCRGALRSILGVLTGLSPERVAFRFGPGGKPAIAWPEDSSSPANLSFNVTHSDDLALIAVARDLELGVDLERMRPISQASRIVESYFSTVEHEEFLRLDEPERQVAFIRAWTRKEAVLKAKGVGLAGLASEHETLFGTRPLPDRFTPALPRANVPEWSLWEAAPRDGYVAALAVPDDVERQVSR